MNDPSLHDDNGSLTIRRRLDEVCDRFERAWQQSLRLSEWPPRVRDYLRESPEPWRRWLAEELVALDLEYRWRHAESLGDAEPLAEGSAPKTAARPRLEDYCDCFAESGLLGDLPAELVVREYRARRLWGDRPGAAEYFDRFPGQSQQLNRLFDLVDQELAEVKSSTQASRAPLQETLSLAAPVPRSPDDLPEQFGRYRVIKKLGQGGMGAVYLAHDSQLDRQVALKVPRLNDDDSDGWRQRFLREARSAAAVHHSHLCPVFDSGVIGDIPYLTMAYIEGQTLAEWLRRLRGKPVSHRQAAALVRKVALALAEAHRHGVVHRDLKPANIMIDRRGGPIVMDFGLARRQMTDDARLTQSGMLLGTPAYMSPEQALGLIDDQGPSCDIYSLGVILYELLAGRLPFSGPPAAVLGQIASLDPQPPSAHRAAIDRALEAICLKAMQKRPADRYDTMEALAAALASYLKSTPGRLEPQIVSANGLKAEPASGAGQVGAARRGRSFAGRWSKPAAGILLAGLALTVAWSWRPTGDARLATTSNVLPSTTAPSDAREPLNAGETRKVSKPPLASSQPAIPRAAGLKARAAAPLPPTSDENWPLKQLGVTASRTVRIGLVGGRPCEAVCRRLGVPHWVIRRNSGLPEEAGPMDAISTIFVAAASPAPSAHFFFAPTSEEPGADAMLSLLASFETLTGQPLDVVLIPGLPATAPAEQFERFAQRIDKVIAKDTVVVVSAGDAGPDGQAPFNDGSLGRRMLIVGATDIAGRAAPFTPTCPLAFWAPGVEIPLRIPLDDKLEKRSFTGAAYAAALAAGVAARLRAERGDLTAEEVVTLLRETSRPSNDGGPPLLNLAGALSAARAATAAAVSSDVARPDTTDTPKAVENAGASRESAVPRAARFRPTSAAPLPPAVDDNWPLTQLGVPAGRTVRVGLVGGRPSEAVCSHLNVTHWTIRRYAEVPADAGPMDAISTIFAAAASLAPSAHFFFAPRTDEPGGDDLLSLLASFEPLTGAPIDVVLIPGLLSAAPSEQFERFAQRIDKAIATNAVVVVSAGDAGPDWPAAIHDSALSRRMLIVGATDAAGQAASFTSACPQAFWAPGVDVPLRIPLDGKLERKSFSGTAYSAAFAAGVAARLRAERGDLTAGEVVSLLRETSRPLADGGPPVLNLEAALSAAPAAARADREAAASHVDVAVAHDGDRAAAEKLVALGAKLMLRSASGTQSADDQAKLPDGLFRIVEVDCAKNQRVVDDDLALLAGLAALAKINLASTRITDQGVVQLRDLPSLASLDISMTAVTNRALTAVTSMTSLKHLFVNSTKVSDEGLASLASMHQLESLGLTNNNLRGHGLEHLKRLSELQTLSIGLNPRIKDDALANLARLSELKWLELSFDVQITDDGLKHLKGLSKLTFLMLMNTQVSDAGLAEISRFGDLRSLFLDGTGVTDEGLRQLQRLTKLELLRLSRTAVGDAGSKHLATIATLQELNLDDTQLTDVGLGHLKSLVNLRRLALRGIHATDAGIAAFKQDLPGCEISR